MILGRKWAGVAVSSGVQKWDDGERKVIPTMQSQGPNIAVGYEVIPYATLETVACGTLVVVSSALSEEVVHNNFNRIGFSSFNPEDYADAPGEAVIK